MSAKGIVLPVAFLATSLLTGGLAPAQGRIQSAQTANSSATPAPKPTAAAPKPAPDSYDDLFARYLADARAKPANGAPDMAWSWMNGLAFDLRARRVNDLVTISVVENITASGSADSALAKASSGS